MRIATPVGELAPAALPASAAGPSLRELIVGSEGVLGVITGLLLRVRTRPARHCYEGVVFDSFEAAAEALRVAVQDRATPDVVRLSDELQTNILLAAGESNGRRAPLGRHGLRSRSGVLVIVGWEGQRDSVDRRRLHTMTLLRRGGGRLIGEGAGRAWAASRFAAPYVRDELLGRGVLVDQFETATTWTGLGPLRAAVSAALVEALGARGTPPLVGCADLARLRHRRVADLHGAGARARRPGGVAVAGRQGRRQRGDRRRRRDDLPPPRDRPRPRRVGRGRARGARRLLAARAEGPPGPGRGDEPGQADPGGLIAIVADAVELSGIVVPPEETFDALYGMRRLEIDEHSARGEVAVRRELLQPWGLVHGGVYAAIAESLASWATALVVVAGRQMAMGLSNNTSFLRPISEGTIHALATRRHRGRMTWVWDVDITDDAGAAVRDLAGHHRGAAAPARAAGWRADRVPAPCARAAQPR